MRIPEEQGVVEHIKGWIIPVMLLFLILALLSGRTLLPLWSPLTWAILLAFIASPLHHGLLRLVGPRHRNLAAFLTTILVALLLVGPSLAAGIAASHEAIALFGRFSDVIGSIDTSKGFSLEAFLPQKILDELLPMFEKYPFLKEGTQQVLRWMTSTAIRVSRNFLGNIVTLSYHLIVIFVSFFFILRDGHLLVSYVGDLVPLMKDERKEFMLRAVVVLRAVVFGVIVTAGVQGFLGTLGWWFVGLPNPLLAGLMMGLLAMIPFVGTPIIWIPGAIYLFTEGKVTDCAVLLFWGVCVVSSIDNFLRPFFISEKGRISTLLVFLGAFGGLASWGFIGLFIGPLILSLSVFFLNSYRRAWKIYRTESGGD
ncbi:MAG: AI-2E family transporter [Synergistaceae bacterium]|jgi:predicted PurR-regulated permease PerM|nr:AI-2E family transporter [Synergistaceae bacterium]